MFIAGLFFTGTAIAVTVEEVHEDCWKGNDHSRFYVCVKQRAEVERATLVETEKSFRDAISKSQEPKSYLKSVRQSFEASVSAYRKYRLQQCLLRRNIASMGNGEEENQLACEAILDSNRASELKANLRWLNND